MFKFNGSLHIAERKRRRELEIGEESTSIAEDEEYEDLEEDVDELDEIDACAGKGKLLQRSNVAITSTNMLCS